MTLQKKNSDLIFIVAHLKGSTTFVKKKRRTSYLILYSSVSPKLDSKGLSCGDTLNIY